MKKTAMKLFLAFCMFLLYHLSLPFAAEAQQTVHGHVPSYVKQLGLHALGRLDSTKRLTLGIGLSLQNHDALMSLLQELYDPTSPNFQHWLTPEQFTAQFGPSQADYQAVIDYAKANGFTVTQTYPNRQLLDVTGAVRDIEKAFHLRMMVYNRRSKAGTFYAPDSEPSLNLSVPIVHISGLRNDIVSVPHIKVGPIHDGRTPVPATNNGSGPLHAYDSRDFRAAYIPGVTLNGSGQTVGLLQFCGFNMSDITYYEDNTYDENNHHLPHVPIDTVLLDGANGLPSWGPHYYEVEVCLDIEMAIAMAPGLSKVVVYEAPDTGTIAEGEGYFNDMVNHMVQDSYIKQFSCSWSLYDQYWHDIQDPTADNSFIQMAADGQSFFDGSGDQSAIINSTSTSSGDTVYSYFGFPDDDPYVTSVGGTHLTTSAPGGSYVSEVVWSEQGNGYRPELPGWYGSSGGVSNIYSIATCPWQFFANPSNNQVSSTYRNVPDVALTADSVYEHVDNNKDISQSGTSAAAPLWAGFIAMVNQARSSVGVASIGFINNEIYSLGKGYSLAYDFHRPTGNNHWPGSGNDFNASSGYDLCTGWGTPIGQNLVYDLSTNIIVPDYVSSIYWALSVAVSGMSVVVRGPQTLTRNLSVPSGVTLVISPSATVNLNGYSIVSTGGTIAVQSGANVSGARLQNLGGAIVGLYPTIQATVNATTGNQLIYIPSGTFNENVTATNKSNLIIAGAGENTTIAGSLTFSSCPNLWLQAFWCNGVTLNSCNLANVWCSVSGNPSQNAVSLFYCTGFDQSGTDYNAATGLLAYESSGEILSGADFVSNTTSVASSTGSNVEAVGSQFCTSVYLDFNAQHNSSITAYYCYYQNGTPRYYTNFGGRVGIQGPNYSCTSQSVVSGDPKIQKEHTSSVQSQSDDSTEVEFSQIDTSYFSLLKTIKEEARKSGLSNNGQLHAGYLGVLNDFKEFIKNNPQSPLAVVALTTAANGYGVFGDYDGMKSLLNEIMTNGKLAQLNDAARDLMVDYYRNTKDYDGAISAADAFVKDCKNDSELVPDVMLKKGLILHYDKNMPGDAATCFSTIVNNYPGSEAARFAENELQLLGTAPPKASQENASVDDNFGITLSNYPNPFNPTTVINYQLPKSSHVSIKVYDVLGREVVQLVNEYETAGKYSAQFDGSNLASGVYFYRIQAGDLSSVGKMLLAK